jgi:hypothetical protein
MKIASHTRLREPTFGHRNLIRGHLFPNLENNTPETGLAGCPSRTLFEPCAVPPSPSFAARIGRNPHVELSRGVSAYN